MSHGYRPSYHNRDRNRNYERNDRNEKSRIESGSDFFDIINNSCTIENKGKDYEKWTHLGADLAIIHNTEYNKLQKAFFELSKIKKEREEAEAKKKS